MGPIKERSGMDRAGVCEKSIIKSTKARIFKDPGFLNSPGKERYPTRAEDPMNTGSRSA